MITNATIETLDQGLEVLEKISDDDYTTKLQLVYGGTVGGHYRHVLEHFTTLLKNYTDGFANYDLRERDLSIETNRTAAIQATKELKKVWIELDPALYDQKIELQGKLSHNIEESMKVPSTFGREVVYSMAHAHHHYAIIGVMCAILERPSGVGFGVAPSTVRHREVQDSLSAS